MRIGLLRHFPVTRDLPTGWLTADDLHIWRSDYERADVVPGDFDLGGVDWQACISSDIARARETARIVYPGNIEHTPLLREPNLGHFNTGGLRLPAGVWRWVLRFAWLTGHRSQRACRDEFRQRVLTIANRLDAAQQDTLVVSHAGQMAYLSHELRRRGFTGPKLRIAKHATVYIYDKPGRD